MRTLKSTRRTRGAQGPAVTAGITVSVDSEAGQGKHSQHA